MRQNQRLKRKVRNSYFISTLSIALVLFLLGSVGYLMLSALDISKSLSENITATVEIAPNLSETQRTALKRRLDASPMTSEVRFSSREEKLADTEFREMFGLEFEDILDENPLMDSFEVGLVTEMEDIEDLTTFAEEVKEFEGVTRVSYPAALVSQVHETMRKFKIGMLFFGGALLFISLVLLNNTIRMAIFSKRSLINTMKLVGATKWFITRPFLWSGLWAGFWAGVVASIMLGCVVYALQEQLVGMLSMAQLHSVVYIMAAMVGGGVTISTLFTWMSVSRFVNMKSNKIHLY